MTEKRGNRLSKETSTYLKGAAHQPVDWYPWGEEAFRRAKELDRPILLDIGATWCHWCHVIDRESYEDPDLAAVINDRFVAIKVDRDERPDIDARYQQAVGAIAGQGGWPLTAFLTPDGKVFYGGTYFPPKDSHGRPSFRRVLLAMADAYRTNKADTLREAEALHQALAEGRVSLVEEGVVNEAMLKESIDSLRGQFDPVNGGISGQQKFPHPGTLEWVMARHHRTREESLQKIFTRTLSAMAKGGVYDQIGGGFHRYSTDPRWIVPHFEKMLYDNAGLLANYVHAWQLTRDPLYRETAEGILVCQEARVVVQHLLEVRHDPPRVRRVPMEAPADLVVHPAFRHRRHRAREDLLQPLFPRPRVTGHHPLEGPRMRELLVTRVAAV